MANEPTQTNEDPRGDHWLALVAALRSQHALTREDVATATVDELGDLLTESNALLGVVGLARELLEEDIKRRLHDEDALSLTGERSLVGYAEEKNEYHTPLDAALVARDSGVINEAEFLVVAPDPPPAARTVKRREWSKLVRQRGGKLKHIDSQYTKKTTRPSGGLVVREREA